jgi:hypothetical protein
MEACMPWLLRYKLSKVSDLMATLDGGKIPPVLREGNNVGHYESGREMRVNLHRVCSYIYRQTCKSVGCGWKVDKEEF